MEGTVDMSAEQKLAAGMNTSLVHVDWMIGSDELDIDGITQEGKAEPLMRKGEWA
jgi:aminopeptidase